VRLILYTGKGGTGKSTIASATAVRAAQRGARTLLVSCDLAHNLSDILGQAVGDEPADIAPDLRALEVDVRAEIEQHWSAIQDYMATFLAYLGMEDAVADEVALLPGADALFLLARILREIESGEYDTVIVDCPPTAGALRLLTFSDAACGKLNKLLDVERKVIKLIRPFARRMKSVRDLLPSDEAYRSFGAVIEHIGRLGALLRDPEVSSVRLVLNPERVATAETRRTYTYFGLFGFVVDGIFVNKVFPQEAAADYFSRWCALQAEQLALIERSFLDTPCFRIRHLGWEPAGVEDLDALGREIFGDAAPDALPSEPRTVTLEKRDGKPQLSFWLPDLDKSTLHLGRKGSDLILTAGRHTRLFALPTTLWAAEVEGAQYEDQRLIVTFSETG